MAVLIADNIGKEFAGDVLFTGVSFSVDRRQRLSLAGDEPVVGELAFAKGTRVALHDQRPPRELGLTLREYTLSGARDLIALEEELRRLEEAMSAGAHDETTLRRYAEAQARLEHAGG